MSESALISVIYHFVSISKSLSEGPSGPQAQRPIKVHLTLFITSLIRYIQKLKNNTNKRTDLEVV